VRSCSPPRRPGRPACPIARIPSGFDRRLYRHDTIGVGNLTQNNVTVTVQSGASITLGDNATNIALDNNSIVTNNVPLPPASTGSAYGRAATVS